MSIGEKYGIAAELFALAFGMVHQMIGGLPPLLGWLIVVGCVVTGIVLIIRGRQERNVKQKEELKALLAKAHLEGRLEEVSEADAWWILARNKEMKVNHGHDDLLELFADRASGVPLNELMTRPCSQCGIPRNQKGKHDE